MARLKKVRNPITEITTLASAHPDTLIRFVVHNESLDLSAYTRLPRAYRSAGHFTVNGTKLNLRGDIAANFMAALIDSVFM
jgi:hypothetical protein